MFNKRLFLTKRRRRSNRFLDLIRLIQSLNPVVAYSISRRLSSSADKLMRVRLGSDNSELDIGFKNNVLDIQSLVEFGGYNLLSYTKDFFHPVWKSQSGVSISQTNNFAPTGDNSWEIDFTNGVFIFQFIDQDISSVQNVVFSAYVKGVAGESINISITNSTNTISIPHTFNGDWQRVNITADFQTDLAGNTQALRSAVGKRSLPSGKFETASWQFEIGNMPTEYQPRLQGGASDCFVTTWYDQIGSNHATQTIATSQPKIYDVLTGDITRENGKPAMVFDGAGDHLFIPNVAGRSNIDSYFVNRHDDTSTTATNAEVYLYPTGNGAGNFGFVGRKNSTTTSLHSSSYGSPSLYKNNILLSPTNRDEVYSLIGQTQNIVNHQGASTSSWNEYQYGLYSAGEGLFHFEGTLQEIVIFDNNLTPDNRQKLHDDINNHYNIF